MAIERNVFCPDDRVSAPRQRGHEIAALATAQHGVVARRQLLCLAFSSDEIQGMLSRRRLHPIHQGVYAVGHRSLSQKAYWMAGVLACGPEALLSHRSGAALTGIRRTLISYVEVTVARRRGAMAGIRSYVCERLEPQDRTVIDGIPCTSVARTLLGLATVLPRRGLERACDEAEAQELFDLRAIEELLDRSRGCRGSAQLRSVLREHAIGTTLTRSELEERALAMLDRAKIPRPEVNVRIVCRPGVAFEVDFLWRAQRVVLETDGRRSHSTRRQIERDRSREAELSRAGLRVLRATWGQIEREPRSVALMVRATLGHSE